jgi:imidazoleglycerol phosphate synthase cyclase subunit
VQFVGLRDAGDPVELAQRYDREGADELVYLDITASSEARQTMLQVVNRTADQVFIPLTVGGGVRTVQDFDQLLRAGADKVSVSTGAVERPELLTEAANRFGSQCVVLSVDAKRCDSTPSGYEITTHGGRRATGRDVVEWVQQACALGAGEILLNAMDADGTTTGYDLTLLRIVREAVRVPIIASGGAGAASDFVAAAHQHADAVLAASVFHFGVLTINQVKEELANAGFAVRRTMVEQEAQRWAAQVRFDDRGLVPVVTQDADSGQVLMVAWTDRAGLRRTLITGEGTYFSRSRGEQWIKGATSGHRQTVIAVHLDCDHDAVLYRVRQVGPACHTGERSCFDVTHWQY